MSVVNAIAEVRIFRSNNAVADLKECCRLLRVKPGAVATFDYAAVEDLEPVWHIFDGPPCGREETLRAILKTLILHFRPHWGLLLPHGRHVIRQNVSAEVRQCFETAGFFKDVPDAESVAWWDGLSNYFRSAAVLGRVEIGRRGEMLSMDHERNRLVAIGYAGVEPLWSAIEDETLGYDILSCNLVSGVPKPIYIEVKASEQTPFVFFLTENEWKVAQAFKDAYVFHFWHLPTGTLRVASVDEIAPHIPLNQGLGTWKKTQILLPRPNVPAQMPSSTG